MRVVSLFSGAGGLDLGFIQAGHEIIWANDFAKDAVETYRHNIGNHILNCDISEVDAKNIPHCDIVIGGFPCQGFSLANLRRSVEDERNKLYLQFVRVLNEKKPAFFVAENVPGILSLDKGKVIEHIVDEFKSCGYTVKYKLHHAADFGTPQSRKRVFIIGTREDISENFEYEFPTPTHSKDSDIENRKPWVSISKALEGIPEPDKSNNLLNHIGSKYKIVEKDFTGHRKTDPDKPCPTLLARGNGKGGVVAIPHHRGHRRLTVRESARVQDFPDNFEFSGKLMSMYRQIGNAVPVNLARHIANQFPLIVPVPEEDLSINPTLVSLFSGCGGMDLGFIEAGFDVVWANEIFKGAVDTYRHNIGDHIVEKDIRDVKSNEVPNSTVIIGGFPCQGFSVANTGRNEDDERNGLYLEFVRLIKEKKPQIFVAENVKGILTLGKGKIFEMIKKDFAEVGYDVRHEVLLAADYGVPQKRERVFIVGIRNDLKPDWSYFPPKRTHFNPEIGTLSTDLQPWVSVGRALSDIPDPDKKNNEMNHTYSKYKLRFNGHLGHRWIDPNKPSPTVTGRGDYKGGVVVLHHPNNKRRMSVRELATVQDFPRDFEFTTTQSVSYVMIGNAVPRGMARAVAFSIKKLLESIKINEKAKLESRDVAPSSKQLPLVI